MPSRADRKEPLPVISRLAKAIGHPLRLRILTALTTDDHSATTLAECFGEGLTASFVFYHLTVLEKDCGAIKLVRSRQVRGGTESFFRLIPSVFLCDAYSQLPQVALDG